MKAPRFDMLVADFSEMHNERCNRAVPSITHLPSIKESHGSLEEAISLIEEVRSLMDARVDARVAQSDRLSQIEEVRSLIQRAIDPVRSKRLCRSLASLSRRLLPSQTII